MTTIAAGTTSSAALVLTPDISGTAVLQTNGATTALTLSASQAATFAGPVITGAGNTTAPTLNVGSNAVSGTATPSTAGTLYSSSSGYGDFLFPSNTTMGYGVIPSVQVYRLTANRSLAASSAAQTIFNVGCTLNNGFYLFEMLARFTKAGASSPAVNVFNLSNLTTSTSITYLGILQSVWLGNDTITTQGPSLSAGYTAAQIGTGSLTTVINVGSTASTWGITLYMRGRLNVSSTVVFNPCIAYGGTISPSNLVLMAGSYMSLRSRNGSGIWN
jgi:hypothetical protein